MKTTFLLTWFFFAVILLFAAHRVGKSGLGNGLGIFIDDRGKYSLSRLQLVLWTVLVLSLLAAVSAARILNGAVDALDFTIPSELLIVLGISVGGAVGAEAIKAGKDSSRPVQITASDLHDKPRWTQIFLVEEGELADKAIDVTKYQNFWLTLILLVAYVVLVVKHWPVDGVIDQLPGFHDTFLFLLGISHAGYLAGKLPDRSGKPDGLTVALRDAGATPVPASTAGTAIGSTLTYVPRNP